MGFDIECIVDIHTYPGEYFCPVCRTLVYPNEALQSQCTHLYCKPCLAHIANSTRACPYDGYLVTEADSKPLIEADKALAENVGKVKVRCLFHRSGCTWEGALSDSSSHCSGCTFGNSAVICNRCGIQITHRQVHDHAQSCPGVYQAQQAAGQDAATSGAATIAAASAIAAGDQKQENVQSAASTSQAQNPQATAARLLPAQDHNQQATANTQAPAAVPAATPTPEQWYQQYYQQYAGYDPYNQSYQQYYPYQQQAGQQYQQVQGHYYPQVYSQPQPQVPVPQVQQQAQPQVQTQVQVQTQPLPQSQPPQPKVQAQSQASSQVPGQGQSQPQSHAPIAPQYQNPAQPNSQPQVPPQFQPNGLGNPTPQMQPFVQPPPHPMLSQPQQYVHMPQYQQPHMQMNTAHVSQSNVQPTIHSQTQTPSQPPTQLHPQSHLQNHPPSYPQTNPPQINQPTIPNAQPQSTHPTGPAVSGHHSYQPPQQMQMGAPQQHPVHPHSLSGSLPMHGQIPQQPSLMRPPMSHGPFPSQQQSSVPSHGQVPSMPPAHQQQFYPHAPPPGPTVQQRPGIQPIQQPMPQQPQSFPGPIQVPYGHFGQQQSMQSQLRPQGAPQVLQPVSQVYTPSKQNVALAPGVQPQQPQNYVGRPLMLSQGMHSQSFLQSTSGFGAVAHDRPAHLASNQPFGDQNYANRAITPEMSDAAAPMQGGIQILKSGEKVDTADAIELKSAKSETSLKNENEAREKPSDRSELSEPLVKDADRDTLKNGSGEPVIQQTVKEEPTLGSSDPPPENPFGSSAVEDKDATPFDSKESQQKDMSAGIAKENQIALSAPGTDGSDMKDSGSGFMGKNQSQHLRNDPSSQNFGQPPGPPPHLQSSLRPQGPEYMHPGQPFNPVDYSQPPLLKQPPDASFGRFPGPAPASSHGGGPGIFGPPPRSFEQHPSAPQRPPMPGVPPGSVDPRSGIMGRMPQHYPEGQFGVQDSVNPLENNILHNQRLNRVDGGPFGQPSGVEPRSRMHGPAGMDSPAFGLRDESFVARPREHGNPFALEPIRPFDQAIASGPPSRFVPPPHHAGGFHPDAPERELPPAVRDEYRGKVDPARSHQDFLKPDPGFGRYHQRGPRSAGREYFGLPSRGPRPFGEGSGPFNLPPDGVGNSFSGRLQRIEPDGPDDMRFGERVATGLHINDLRGGPPSGQDSLHRHSRSDMLGPRNFSGHFRWEEPAGFGPFPHRGRMEELGGGFPHHFAGGESFRGDHTNVPFHSEPGFRSSYSRFPNDGLYSGDLDPFDKTRKRKPMSMGWCRICKIDCETVEGLDVHSQSREHQRMAMDMVKSIKLQNKKKSKLSGDHTGGVEEANKARNTGSEGRGNKPRVT